MIPSAAPRCPSGTSCARVGSSTNIDFEDIPVGGAGDFLIRRAAVRTAALALGQDAGFMLGRQMVMLTPAMALAAGLLSTRAWLAVALVRVARWTLGLGIGTGAGFGFTAEEAAF